MSSYREQVKQCVIKILTQHTHGIFIHKLENLVSSQLGFRLTPILLGEKSFLDFLIKQLGQQCIVQISQISSKDKRFGYTVLPKCLGQTPVYGGFGTPMPNQSMSGFNTPTTNEDSHQKSKKKNQKLIQTWNIIHNNSVNTERQRVHLYRPQSPSNNTSAQIENLSEISGISNIPKKDPVDSMSIISMGQMFGNNDEFDYNEEKAFNFQVLDPQSFISLDVESDTPKQLRGRQGSGFLPKFYLSKQHQEHLDEYAYLGNQKKEKDVRKSQEEFINSINKRQKRLMDNLEN